MPKIGAEALLRGWTGSAEERLLTNGAGILRVVEGAEDLAAVRLTETGQVGAIGGHKLFWYHLNPSAGNSAIELADAVQSGGAVVFDDFHTDRNGHLCQLDPPLVFENGIFLETLTNIKSVVFGFI